MYGVFIFWFSIENYETYTLEFVVKEKKKKDYQNKVGYCI